MDKIKLYVYPHASDHIHDHDAPYVNVIPLSKQGILNHCELVSPEEADYFYMGQFTEFAPNTPDSFVYFKGNEHKHICDIEGDWSGRYIPKWLCSCILTINGAKKEYNKIKMFIRPAFSILLLNMLNNWPSNPIFINLTLTFGFKGFPDPHGVRNKMKEAFELSKLKGEIKLTSRWMAKNNPNDEDTLDYINLLLNSTFSLCPSGNGVDSIRFFESCYFARIPIIISSIFVPYCKEYTKPFYFQINPNLSVEEISRTLIEIKNTDIELLKQMSINAKEYFEVYIRNEYFKDPTLSFIKWLKRNEY